MNFIKSFINIIWWILFAPIPVLSFCLFIFSLTIYQSAIEISFFLILPISFFLIRRSSTYIMKNIGSDNPLRTLFEAGLYWGIVLGLFAYFVSKEFPAYEGELLIMLAIVIYVAYHVINSQLYHLVTKPIDRMLQNIEARKEFYLRLFAVFFLFIAVILVFSGVFRALSIHDATHFNRDFINTIDSIYFSVATITTLGYGEITPQSDIAKILLILESLIGVFLLAIFISLAISVRLEDVAKEPAQQAAQIKRFNSALNSRDQRFKPHKG